MKSKCSFILRSSIALLLTALMIIGSISTVLAATVDMADLGRDADVAETGAISNITAQVSGKSSHSSTTFPLEFTESLTKDSWYGIRINFTENGDHYCKASDNNNITVGTAKELGWGNGSSSGDSGMSWFQATKTGTFSFSIYTSGGKNYVLVSEAKTPLTTPTITIGGKTSGATVASGSTAAVKITNWNSFSSSITNGYCTLALYKGDTKIGNNITAETTNFTFTESGDYYVKCEPTASTEATYSASSSSTVDVTVTLTIYVKNAADWSNIYYYVYTSNSSHGTDWPGTKITSTAIGTIDGKNVYKVENVPQYSYIILNVGSSSAQYPNNVALANGKLYPTGTTAPTVVDYSSSLLDKPKYDVTFTPSPTGGTVKVDNSSTSPVKVTENTDFTILAKPNTGYTVDTVTVGTTTLTATGGNDTNGYTYTSNIGTAAKTVTATFRKINYTVDLNKNANDATAGTASVTAQYDSDMPSATMPTRTGYTFAGYYDTSATSGGTQYYTAAGASARTWNKTEHSTLYARWTEVTGGAVAKAYTSGSESSTGGTVKIGDSGSASGSVNLSAIGITSSNTVIATTKSNYSFTGWQFSGTNATHLRYRFGTSGEWLTPATGTTYGTSSNTTIYIKTDGSSGITTSNAEVRALFVPTEYSVSVGAQYTEDGTTYTDFQTLPSGVTIAANTATYQTGVAVAAPGTDPTGYVFAGWYSANGTFNNGAGNANDKDTVFKPNANNTKAIARYKKIFTITSSVDNIGTGAGTVNYSITNGAVDGQANKILAGGSYSITATAANGSAIESIKVNDGTGTTTSPRTVSSVSADQTVVVKFKSNVKIGYRQFDGTTTWNESDMTVQSDGTYIYQFNNVPSGRKGQFKAKVGDSWKDVDLTYTDFDDGATSCTLDSVNDGGVNYRINTTEAVSVKVIFNATDNKISKVIVDPVSATTYAITVGSPADAVLTATYRGTEYAEGQTINARAGQQITFSATTAESKYVSGYTLGGDAVTSPYTVTASDDGKTLTCSVADKLTVNTSTNKSTRGTVSVDKSFAVPGDTIKITVTPLAGSLKSLTAVYGNGHTYEYKNGAWPEVVGTTGSALTSKLFSKIVDIAATGAELDEAAVAAMADIVPVGASQEINMTLEQPSSVTINALFDPYSAESTWYYNGYDTSGNALSGYHGKQMTEGMVSGEKFSYYHVEGRTGSDQLMTVSNGAASSGTRYVYFTASSEGGWSTDENHQYAYFYNGSGDAGNAWPGYKMTKYTTNEYSQNVYRVEIPTSSSPTGVVFNNASNAAHKTTNVTDLTKGGYYLLSTHHNDNGTEVHDWQSYDCTYPSAGYSTGTEYFYSNSIYTADFSTKGFYNHNTNSKDFAKPKDLGTSTGDYYVNVLYAGKTYTINGVTKTVDNDPLVIWSAEPLSGDDENVTVYAKDGSIRSENNGLTYANIADTKIFAADGTTAVGTNHTGNITDQTYETVKSAKGETIVIKTQIGANDSGNLSNAADLKAKYYVRGFCVNGEVSQLLEWNADGLYTLTFKVPEDGDITKFEITPIYYLKDTNTNPIVTYRVTGFTDELKAVGAGKPGWGDTLYTYPFYGKLGGYNNSFGAYPGQPMVYYKGQYQMQIPQKSTAWDYDNYYKNTIGANNLSDVNNTTVSGVTMSNGYYDLVHRQVMGYGNNAQSSDHVQTYDYGDFFKIFNEKSADGNKVDNIVFDFKYETTTHNLETNAPASPTPSNLASTYKNGFELLTNFHGRHVDLFGNPLSGDAADPSKTKPLYVVSIGGVNGSAGVENVAGYYATEWKVFAPNTTTGTPSASDSYKLVSNGKSSIPPEILILNNNSSSFNVNTYPSADANHTITDWQALYTTLEDYRGKPVMISYEAADAQQGQGDYFTGTNGATRNDGRWLYSKNGESITSTIKIQYSDDNGANYTDLNTTTPQVSGLSAYFTNDGVEGEMTYSTTIDPDKTFDFEAKTTNGSYKFVGWYMDDGTKITSDNVSHTERSGSYTFVAKFMQVQSGQLILSHSADKDTISGTDYQGAGTAKIGVVVKNGDEVIRTIDLSTSDITLDDKIIKSDSTYTIDVTLEATATGNDTYGTTVLANPSSGTATYFSEKSSTTSGKTKTIVLNSFTVGSLFSGTTQNVKNIIYHSYFNQAVFNYTLTFSYKDRFDVSKSFTRQGQLTSAQAANTSYVEQSDGSFSLLPAFMQTVAPFESNVGEDITWNFNKAAFTQSVSTYTCTATINATQTKSSKRNVTFKLPYAHTDGIATGGNSGTAAEALDFALTGNNAVDVDTIPVLLNDAENGIYNEDGKKNLIAAPATINENGTTKYFQYWSVKSTSADKEGDPEVARCYFQGFNFCALDNYTVTPIYDTQKTDISNSGIYTGASYLETSRNQWNDNQDRAKTEYNAASDLLYNDFILNYNFKGVDIYKGDSDSEDILELGVVVERVKELDINQDGSKNTDISNYTSVAENLDTVRDIINGTTTDNKYYKDTIQKTWLDNKNRAKFYEAFYNGRGWSMDKQSSAAKYAYRNYVYRAYTYIMYKDDQNNTQIKLSEKPAYFTMYNEAVADYTVPTSGN